MSLSGEDKEIRIQSFSPTAYNNNNNNNSIENPPEKTRGSDPNSGGSKLCKPSNPRVSYRECLRNHAANMGGNVTDGCGEFMPGGDDGSLEALKCAACNCHRNFHRKEVHGEGVLVVHPLQLPPPLPSPSMSQHRGGGAPHWGSMLHPMKMPFGGGGGSAGTDSSSEELNFHPFHPNAAAAAAGGPPPHFATKKRFRTKFTAEQKEKMLAFAEKCGWRIPREDDAEVQRFCAEVGVKRQVFKVWMHNNKITSAKKPTPHEF